MTATLIDALVAGLMERYDTDEPPRPGLMAESRRSTVEDFYRQAVYGLVMAGYAITRVDDRQAVIEPEPDDGQWALVELMGHRRVWGRVTETTLAGAGILRIDTPDQDGSICRTQYVNTPSIYCLTPVSRETVMDRLYPPVRALARGDDLEDDYDGDDEDHDY